MRKTLLIAAAALAASVISSQAQVYSQNIVGYVNTAFPAGTFVAVGNPVNNGDGTNSASDVLASIPDDSFVYIWTGTTYASYTSGIQAAGGWYDITGTTPVPTPLLPVGQGFYVVASSPFTNTFVGTVLVTNNGTGTISTNIYNFDTNFRLVNPAVPIGGGLVSSLQMNAIPDDSFVYIWNGTSYSSYASGIQAAGGWYDITGTTPEPEPTVAVGQAFFVQSSAPWTWTLTYTNQ